jgi:hypothetical protein
MKRRAVAWVSKFFACVIAAAACYGCVAEPPADERDLTADATVCTTVTAGTWRNTPIAPQTGPFYIDFAATPSGPAIDAVIGLSDGSASTWTKLAAIVRFNPQGFIDVRDGGAYRPSTYRYRAGVRYGFRMDVHLPSRTYRVLVHEPGSYGLVTLASGMAFRTEQAAVTQLTNVASFVENQGSIELCGFTVYPWQQTCPPATAGGGFVSTPIEAPGPVTVAYIDAAASDANMDGVFGLTSGPADAYNDYAASVRFATTGNLEARSGDVYRADAPVPYAAGDRFRLALISNLATKRYSVLVTQVDAGGSSIWNAPVMLARDYAFRPQQLAVTTLDHFTTVISSSFGRVDACARNRASGRLAYVRNGNAEPLALANNALLLGDGTRTIRLDAAGRQTGSVPRTGRLAVDGAGNIYIASVANGSLTVDAYTSALASRWTRTFAVTGHTAVTTGTNAAGDLSIVVAGDDFATIERLGSDGTRRPTTQLANRAVMAVGLDANGYVLARRATGGLVIEQYSTAGALAWSRTIPGEIGVEAIARGADGSIALAGHFRGEIDFGDGVIYPSGNPESDASTYFALLSSTGATVYSKPLYTSWITGIATNGTQFALSTWTQTQFRWMELRLFDATGPTHGWGDGSYESFGFGSEGTTGAVAISSSGRIYQNLAPSLLQRFASVPFLIAIDP